MLEIGKETNHDLTHPLDQNGTSFGQLPQANQDRNIDTGEEELTLEEADGNRMNEFSNNKHDGLVSVTQIPDMTTGFGGNFNAMSYSSINPRSSDGMTKA